jgi:hypothetical protein
MILDTAIEPIIGIQPQSEDISIVVFNRTFEDGSVKPIRRPVMNDKLPEVRARIEAAIEAAFFG